MAGDAVPSIKPGFAFACSPERTRHVFLPEHIDRLRAIGTLLDDDPMETFAGDHARAILAHTEILITAWGCPRIDAATLAAAPRLRLVAHAAGTVKPFLDPVVLDAGVLVTNAADANALPVAEFTLAAILISNKRVMDFRRLYREARTTPLPGGLADAPIGNWRRTIGLVGASRIGRRVIELLRPFDFEVLLFDPYVPADEAARLGVRALSLDELMATSDVVSLHAPALASTRHMIDAGRLARMRDGATLINTARGSLVDPAALTRELVSGRIAAVIDVTEPEVLPADSPLYDLPNVFLTPHIAGAMGLERARLGALVVEEVERFCRGEPLRHRVDPASYALQA